MAIRLIPFIVLAAVFTWFILDQSQVRIIPPPGGHWYTALMTDAEIFSRYLWNIVAPVGLSAFYGVADVRTPLDPRFLVNVGVLFVAVSVSIGLARSRRRALFGWLWFFGALGPHINIVATSFLMQDRYVYLSAIGILLVMLELVMGVSGFVARRAKGDQWGRWLAAPALV